MYWKKLRVEAVSEGGENWVLFRLLLLGQEEPAFAELEVCSSPTLQECVELQRC